jgi:hypothetical protein
MSHRKPTQTLLLSLAAATLLLAAVGTLSALPGASKSTPGAMLSDEEPVGFDRSSRGNAGWSQIFRSFEANSGPI